MRTQARIMLALAVSAMTLTVIPGCSSSGHQASRKADELYVCAEFREKESESGRMKFYSDKSWTMGVKFGNDFTELARGTYTGEPTGNSSITITMTHALDTATDRLTPIREQDERFGLTYIEDNYTQPITIADGSFSYSLTNYTLISSVGQDMPEPRW